MLEDETFSAASSIAARGQDSLQTIGEGQTNELTKSFLVKRIEIDFMAVPDLQTNDATAAVHAPYGLYLIKTSGPASIDTVTEMLGARFDDIVGHQNIIWRRTFMVNPSIIDDADNVIDLASAQGFKTSKSFSKGFRLDKDDVYQWVIFNPTAVALDIVATWWLQTRYWGVYVQ